MDRAFRRGCLEIDFPVKPFTSAAGLLADSARLYFRNLAPLVAITFATILPGKLLLQFLCYIFDIAPDGFNAYILMDASDLVLSAVAVPAIIFALIANLRSGRPARLSEALRWGRLLWRRMLWNKFKVEITVALWSLMLIVPGILAMIRLSLTEPVIAVEGAEEAEPLKRSEDLTEGRRGRIFAAFLPLAILSLAAEFLGLKLMALSGYSRLVIALSDTLLSLAGQFGTAMALLIYLGVSSEKDPQSKDQAKRLRAA
jgi:hypothetical protein